MLRSLAAFFALMALFTVVSRAAASVMVAKVQVDTVKDGELAYKLEGTGSVKENAEKYIELREGYKIGKVHIEKGGQVEKGDLLFEYDLGQLKEKKNSLDRELKKLRLEYEKSGLTPQNPDGSGDVKAAELEVRTAKEEVKAAKAELADSKKNTVKEKEEAYKEAVSAYEEVKASQETEENKAKRAVSDAESELEEVKQPLLKLTERIDNYKTAVTSGDEDRIAKASGEIYDFYYDGAYEDHLEEKSKAEEEVKRAVQDLEDINEKWEKAIDEWDRYSTDDAELKAYYAQVAARQEEVKNDSRVLEDAQEKLVKLSEADKELNNALINYRRDIEGYATDTGGSYAPLYQLLYDNLKVDETKIQEAALKLDRAREDEEQVHRQWEEKSEAAAEKQEELAGTIKQIRDGEYDYKEDQKETSKAVRQAEQALENAQLSLQNAKTGEQVTRANNQVQDRTQALDREMLRVDMDEKQEEIGKLEADISHKGKVFAPLAGTVTKNDLEQGMVLSGQEKLSLATGGYELVITAGKEDMKQFAAGDELQIDTSAGNEKITSQIENIELPDSEGNVRFTALLPEGDYKEGTSLDYKMEKESVSYPECIPVQALRQDSGGTYVLLVKEKDSVLGKEETAFRLSVTVISQDGKTAAVEASLSEEDRIITGSSKNISEGDRVRIYEMD